MKIVLAGCTGFIGRRLVKRLAEEGHECTVLIRSPLSLPAKSCPEGVRLAPYTAMPDAGDAVINLGGETVVGRWTKAKKARIMDTRVLLTRDMVKWMTGLEKKPSVFISGSAVGIYGDRGDEMIAEDTSCDPNRRFRAQVCMLWEQEANEAKKLGIRVVNLRIGNVLDPKGGMIGQMVPWLKRAPFIMPYGRKAYLPWISMADTIGIIDYALTHESVFGPINLVAPTPATNGELFETLGSILKKRVAGEMPAWMLKVALGEFSEALLGSQKILPEKIIHDGYVFNDSELGEYLRESLEQKK